VDELRRDVPLTPNLSQAGGGERAISLVIPINHDPRPVALYDSITLKTDSHCHSERSEESRWRQDHGGSVLGNGILRLLRPAQNNK